MYQPDTERRQDEATATELGRRQWTGIAALGAQRIARCLGVADDGIEALAKVFQLHPHFHPRSYVDFRVALRGEAGPIAIV